MRIQSKYLDEKLTSADPTSKWVSDFVHSDNPKFAGKSKKERIRMALGAAYAAKGQSRNEETYKDTGWKKPERNPGAKTKNVSGKLARQGMKQAEKEAKKVQEENKAYRAQDAESKRTTGMSLQQRSKMYDDIQKKLKDQEEEYRKQGILPPKNEAVSQDKKDELRSELGHEDHLPHTVHINGKPWKKFEGYNAGPRAKKATDTLNAKGKKATYGISEEVDESIGSAIGGAIGQYTGSKIGMDGPGRAHGELAGRAIEYHVRKFAKKIKDKFTKKDNSVNSSFEYDGDSNPINELDEPTLSKFATRARFSSNPKHREAAKQAMEKLKKKQEPKNEEVEQIDELKKSTLASYAKKATHDARIKHGIGKDFERISKSSRKPEYKQSAKDWEERYKSDARRREAGVGKAIDRLAKEEVEQVDEVLDSAGKLAGYLGKATLSGLKSAATGTGKFRKRQAGIQRAVDKTKAKINNEEVEELEEDGKLKGGAKDPCWKGYQMVGTKKKDGRKVPNCVPREETELKSFKALREELNGNSNRS